MWLRNRQSGWQPKRGSSHENANDIPVVSNFTSAPSIHSLPGGPKRTLVGARSRADSKRLCVIGLRPETTIFESNTALRHDIGPLRYNIFMPSHVLSIGSQAPAPGFLFRMEGWLL